jgi:predicted RNase H-like HicB family nuclease
MWGGNGNILHRKDESMKIEIEREGDGRWIAEVLDLPGVIVYANTREEAVVKVQSLALRVIADRLDHGEGIPELDELFAVSA